ncbi:MAG TPA: hypothetical protein VM529_08295 [Gemmata sp.]|nr:hypothetical protein [Gemmata sp.]
MTRPRRNHERPPAIRAGVLLRGVQGIHLQVVHCGYPSVSIGTRLSITSPVATSRRLREWGRLAAGDGRFAPEPAVLL